MLGSGWDIAAFEAEKKWRTYPEVMRLEDHLIAMKRVIEELKPNRIAAD